MRSLFIFFPYFLQNLNLRSDFASIKKWFFTKLRIIYF
ncbi:hypothetical protein LEP1GSC203_2230 [Leptospira terpstrae serovar Hualin str. LT 11-33 = ATCC 700639]|uniref:Uncharacterized protein n=1 Tax=Leptospira terpstrae serovar Hualin str. LT 11-33 = ATCC 700639 TaxID=1257025 RepID=N1W086_9LEPT|nr:hypothetical protein LEP1GSC203_2230 [Leptospira terpstrae serovar Hualin str. LT 11-33 = ATCC 700639]